MCCLLYMIQSNIDEWREEGGHVFCIFRVFDLRQRPEV